MSVSLANSYSKALVELAIERGNLTATAEAARYFSEALKIPELLQTLAHPKLPSIEKKLLIARLLPEKTPVEFANLLKLVIDRRREHYLPVILERVLDLIIETQGNEIIEIVSARILSTVEQAEITERLSRLWQVPLHAKCRENKNLRAGIIIRRGDQIFDGSLRGRLASLRDLLISESKTIGKEGI